MIQNPPCSLTVNNSQLVASRTDHRHRTRARQRQLLSLLQTSAEGNLPPPVPHERMAGSSPRHAARRAVCPPSRTTAYVRSGMPASGLRTVPDVIRTPVSRRRRTTDPIELGVILRLPEPPARIAMFAQCVLGGGGRRGISNFADRVRPARANVIRDARTRPSHFEILRRPAAPRESQCESNE